MQEHIALKTRSVKVGIVAEISVVRKMKLAAALMKIVALVNVC
jgi:hypothetical protein